MVSRSDSCRDNHTQRLENTNTEDMEQQQKRSHRLRTLKGGSIRFRGDAGIDCVIRNMSATGALLEVENPVGIPDKFTLVSMPENMKRRCQVVWRKSKRIGVRFVDTALVGGSLYGT